MPSGHTIDGSPFKDKLDKIYSRFNETDDAAVAFAMLSAAILSLRKEADMLESRLLPMYESAIMGGK